MSRPDISPNLIHFTKGETEELAFKRLQKIIREKKLVGGSKMIKGGYRCVCFSEAPVASLSGGLVNEEYYSKYSPFGIMVSKKWLFTQGGRPVIYQPLSEYDTLEESHRWRHMTLELRETHSFADFSWEREWRIKCEELPFDQITAQIIVRDDKWAARLKQEHDDDQDYTVMQYSIIMGENAEHYRESFGWTVVPLT